jgi:hypothetical protein
VGDEAILNVAANAAGTSVFVMFTSSVAPHAIPTFTSSACRERVAGAMPVQFQRHRPVEPPGHRGISVNMYGHTGGGWLCSDDGSVLFATGDNGDSGRTAVSTPRT